MEKVLPWFQVGSIVLSALIVWLATSGRLGFATGRFVQQRDHDSESLSELRDLVKNKADASAIAAINTRIDAEHEQRCGSVRALDVNQGRLSERIARIEVRVDHTEKRVETFEERMARWKWRRSDEGNEG